MERKELIRQLRSVKLDNGNPIQWVHLICEAAEMLEKDEERSCVGCVRDETCWCSICARGHKDRYETATPASAAEDSVQKGSVAPKGPGSKDSLSPIPLSLFRQLLFDCGADLVRSCGRDYKAIAARLLELSNRPIKEEAVIKSQRTKK